MLSPLQVGGLQLPNVVAVLLLPVFIFPGFIGLRLRLYVARRSDEYTRLETAVYSWTISAISLILLYIIIFWLTGDATLVPEALRVSQQPSNTSETGLQLHRLLLGYALHIGLCAGVGIFVGTFAYNFTESIQVGKRDSNLALVLEHIAPGHEIELRTKDQELLRATVPTGYDDNDKEGVLLKNAERIIENENGPVSKNDLGPRIFVNKNDISRISLVNGQSPENIDPAEIYEDPDRLQSFLRSLYDAFVTQPKSVLADRNELRSELTWDFALLSGLPIVFSTIAFGFQQNLFAHLSEELSVGGLLGMVAALVVFIVPAYFYCGSFQKKTSQIAGVGFVLFVSLAYCLFSTISPSTSIPGVYNLLIAAYGGIAFGIISMYCNEFKRSRSGLAISFFSVVVFLSGATSLQPGAAAIPPDALLLLSILSFGFIYYEMIAGGPSRPAPWGERARLPLTLIVSILVVVLTIVFTTMPPNNNVSLWFLMMLSLISGLCLVWVVYYNESQEKQSIGSDTS
jgi:hypothetical protein